MSKPTTDQLFEQLAAIGSVRAGTQYDHWSCVLSTDKGAFISAKGCTLHDAALHCLAKAKTKKPQPTR